MTAPCCLSRGKIVAAYNVVSTLFDTQQQQSRVEQENNRKKALIRTNPIKSTPLLIYSSYDINPGKRDVPSSSASKQAVISSMVLIKKIKGFLSSCSCSCSSHQPHAYHSFFFVGGLNARPDFESRNAGHDSRSWA